MIYLNYLQIIRFIIYYAFLHLFLLCILTYGRFLMLFAWTDDKITEENGGQSEYFFQKNTSAPEFFVLLFQAVDLLFLEC